MSGAIETKTVTFDFHRLLEEAIKLSCSEFGTAVITHMQSSTARPGEGASRLLVSSNLRRLGRLLPRVYTAHTLQVRQPRRGITHAMTTACESLANRAVLIGLIIFPCLASGSNLRASAFQEN